MALSAQVGLQQTGTFSYGGYVFDGAYHLLVEAKNFYDEAGRVIMYTIYTFSITAIVADATPANVEERMQQIHDILMTPGLTLVMNQKGFNDSIDTSQQAGRDVNFGPKPQTFLWRPIGDRRAVEFTWTVDVALAKCGGYRNTGILGINYDITVNTDRHGNSIRTIAGYIQVANSVIGLAIENDPETVLPLFFKAEVPSHYFREIMRKFNAARTRVDFQITDTEIGTNRPMNSFVTEIEGDQHTRWGMKEAAFLLSTLTIRMNMRADIHPSFAYLVALDILQQRIKPAKDDGKDVFILSIDITEDIWGRTSEITFTWQILGTATKIVQDSGLYSQIVTTDAAKSGSWDWDLWRDGMKQSAFTAYGNSRWKYKPKAGDKVISLCDGANKQAVVNNETDFTGWTSFRPQGYANTIPTKENSYLEYYMGMFIDSSTPTAIQTLLQSPISEGGSNDITEAPPGAIISDTPVSTKNVVQQAGIPTVYLWIIGQAKRAGYAVPEPKIIDIGGETPILLQNKFLNGPTKNALGVTVYSAVWEKKYAVAGIPSVITALANPQQGIKFNNGYTLGSGTLTPDRPADAN